MPLDGTLVLVCALGVLYYGIAQVRVRDYLACRVGVLCICLSGCGDQAAPSAETVQRAELAQIGGVVVSTVNGRSITVADIEAVVKASDLDPRQALASLQAERLLMDEAQRRGFERNREVRHVTRQALAQAVLTEEATRVEVTDAQLRAAYAAQKPRFSYLERRASLHVLAAFQDPAQDAHAYEFIRHVCREFAAAPATEVESVWARYQTYVEPGLTVSAERIPAVDRDAAFVKPYLDALFSLPAPGTVPTPVRTRFGWHAIVVREIIPSAQIPFDEASGELRPELELKAREARTEELLNGLRRDAPVRVEADAVQRIAALGT